MTFSSFPHFFFFFLTLTRVFFRFSLPQKRHTGSKATTCRCNLRHRWTGCVTVSGLWSAVHPGRVTKALFSAAQHSFLLQILFYLSYSTWYISSAYQQVDLVLFSGVCFSLTAKSFACIFELPSVTTLPCQNKTMRSFWCSAHFALSTETQVGFLERRGRHYFFRTVVVARKQTFADAPLTYNRIELNRIDCALLSSSQNWKSHLVGA